jgi:hypothetical protein
MKLVCFLLSVGTSFLVTFANAQNHTDPIEIQKVFEQVYRGEVYRQNGRRVGPDRLVFITAFVPEANKFAQLAQKRFYQSIPFLLLGSIALTHYTVVPAFEGPGPRLLGTGGAVALLGAGFHLSTRSEIHMNNAVYLYNREVGRKHFQTQVRRISP